MNAFFFRIAIRRIKAIRFLIKDKSVPLHQKLLIAFGVIYLISPLDLIPFPVLGFSWMDDFALWAFILYLLKEKLDKYNEDYNNEIKFNGKKIIDDVKYEVNSDEDDNYRK